MNTPILKINYVYYSTNDGIIVREKLDKMLNSDLTIVSTGWKIYTNIKLNNKTTEKSKTETSLKSTNNKMMQVINKMTGKRELINEIDFQKKLKKIY